MEKAEVKTDSGWAPLREVVSLVMWAGFWLAAVVHAFAGDYPVATLYLVLAFYWEWREARRADRQTGKDHEGK